MDPKSGPVFSELRGGAEEPLDVVTTIAPPEAKVGDDPFLLLISIIIWWVYFRDGCEDRSL